MEMKDWNITLKELESAKTWLFLTVYTGKHVDYKLTFLWAPDGKTSLYARTSISKLQVMLAHQIHDY